MFFYDKIKSIKPTDRVLEVGPGGMPHPRSDVLLEKVFDEKEAAEQRGHTPALHTEKEIVYYEGQSFPFKDGEFDYVICTHVLEHVPASDIEHFLSELQRVAAKGYLEYPTIYYEHLYNFKVHTTLLNRKNGIIHYVEKDGVGMNSFFPVHVFFYNTLKAGMQELLVYNQDVFFQGFEWFGRELKVHRTTNIEDFIFDGELSINPIPERPRFYRRILSRLFR